MWERIPSYYATKVVHKIEFKRGGDSGSYGPMSVLPNTQTRSPRQRYVWPEKALSLVRSTRTPKKDGAVVVKQLQEITMYPEKVSRRLAERHGFRRPHFRREWSREDIEQILKMCESDRPVTEIAEYFVHGQDHSPEDH